MSDEVVYHHAPKTEEYGETPIPTTVKVEPEAVEQSDRGMLSFLGKKEEENKCDDEVVYHHAPKTDEYGETPTPSAVKVEPEEVEQSDRGMFSFMGKKEEEKTCDDAVISSEFEEKVQVSEPEPELKSEEKKESLLDKLHRSDSKSSSSSDEEEDEDGEKKKKKKSLKEKIKEKFDKKEEEKVEDDTRVPIEKYEEVAVPTPTVEEVYPIMDHGPPHIAPEPELEPEEKKGFMEKIKEKLPGGHKKVEDEHVAPPPTPVVAATPEVEGEHKEKKGIFEKIKEKIPGYHPKSEDEKEKEKECD